jgi:hypothetical protein
VIQLANIVRAFAQFEFRTQMDDCTKGLVLKNNNMPRIATTANGVICSITKVTMKMGYTGKV